MTSDSSGQAELVLRALLSFGRRIRSARPPGGATLAELSILAVLRRCGSLPARAIAAEERLQPQSLSRLIASLERKRLIIRSRTDEDQRLIFIALSALGESVLNADLRSRKAWLEKALAEALTDRERAALVSGCEVMLKLAG